MHDDVKYALRIANQMPASWRDKRLPQMSEVDLETPHQERAQGGSVHDFLTAEDLKLLDYIMSHDEPGFEERKSGGRINGVLDYDPDWDMHLRKGYATDGSVEGDVQFAPDDYKPEEEAKQHAPAPMMAQHDYAMHMPQPEVRYDTGPHAGEPTLKAAPEPTTREQIAQTMLGNERPSPERRQFVEGLLGTSGLGQQHMGAADFVPLAGQALQAQESYQHKDPKGFLMATVPVPGAAIEGKLAQAGRTAIEAAAPVVQHAAEQVVGAVAPQMTKSQSQEAMRQAWAAGQGNTDKYNTWNHQWNMEEGPKFRAAQPEVPAVGPGTVVQKKPVGFQIHDPYERVTNPAGFYSHGAEAARGLPQQKGTLEQMLAALKGYGVKPEEIRWSGVEQAFTGRPHVTGEELAQHFEQRIPKVNRIEKADVNEFDHDLYDQFFEEEYQRLHDDDFQNDFNFAMEDHDLENMSERERDRLEETIRDELSEQYSQMASENASQMVTEYQREHGPKWGSDEYNFPGGYDYREHVLNIPHTDTSYFHPDVMNPLTQEEYQKLKNAYTEASNERATAYHQEKNDIAAFHRENAEQYADNEIKELREAGKQFSDPAEVMELQGKYYDLQDQYGAARKTWEEAWRANDRNAPTLEAKAEDIQAQVRAAYDDYSTAKHNTEEAEYDRIVDQITGGALDPEVLARMLGKDKEFKALSQHERILATEAAELAARKELQAFEQQLKDESEQAWSDIPEYERQLYQHQTHWGDIENPILHNRFKTYTVTDPNTGEQFKVLNKSEGQSDFAKEEFQKTFTPEEEKNYLDLINKTDKTPEENLRLAQLVGKNTGKYVEAPYVGSTDRWAELSAKDALAHAIENGYDRIFITGGKEQAKRWSGNMREAAEQVLWNTAEDDGAASVVDSMREPYSAALYGKKYNDLTSSETYDLQQKMRRIIRGEEPNIFPDDIYAVPTTIKKVMFRMNNGDSARLSVKQIKTPNGGTKNIIVDSNKSAFPGQNLSAVAGQDLANQIMSEADGGIHLKDFMMGSSGYENVYDQAYPKAYKKIMKSLDPEAKVEAGTMPTKKNANNYVAQHEVEDEFEKFTPEQKEAWGDQMRQILEYMSETSDPYRGFDTALQRYASPELSRRLNQLKMDQRQGTWVHITPKMRDEYNRLKRKYGAVFPAYKRGGAVKDSVSKIGNQMSKVRDSVMKLAQGGSAVDDALRIAKQGRFPLHQAIARTGYDDGGPVWDKPRPKKLGKPEPLSKKEKASAKAAAKAAGRPWPNLVDNMRAAKAAGGEVDDALRLAKGGGAWTRKEGQDPAGGLNSKGRASAKAEGHNLKPPAPHPKNEKDAARRKSFCSRMSGMKRENTSSETANDPNSRINKSLRAWNC